MTIALIQTKNPANRRYRECDVSAYDVEELLSLQRARDWEHAKGVLRGIAATFKTPPSGAPSKFERFDAALDAFVEEVEGSELYS